jgi:putative transposase
MQRCGELGIQGRLGEQCFVNRILRGKAYRQLKEQYGLSAQPAQHVIKKVADAYKVNRTNVDRSAGTPPSPSMTAA